MTLIDTHCHLYMSPLDADPTAVQARAAARGVTELIIPAYDQPSWDLMTPFESDPSLHTAYGIHPWLAHESPPGGNFGGITTSLADRLDATSAVAIGEIGLDTKIDTSDLTQQMPLLEAQLQLAVDRDLPVILHCRGAFEEMLSAIENHGGRLRGVLHAWSRGPDLGERFIRAGLHLGLGGSITRPTAKRPRKSALRLPLERLLLETDAPGIGLHNVPAVETEPHHVADVAAALVTIRHEPLFRLAAATTANARELFRLSAPQGESP